MGYYINKNSKGKELSVQGKANDLIADGATVTDSSFKEDLVCVVENAFFDAAVYAHSQSERDEFENDGSGRRKTWLVYKHAKQLSGFDLEEA